MDLVKEIMSWGERTPDRAAHISADNRMSYAELCERATKLSWYLERTLGDDRSPVVVLGHKEPELLVAFLGVVLSGRAYAPVDTIVPAERVDQISATLSSKLVLTPEKIRAAIVETSLPQKIAKPLEEDSPYYIMFTSGSTGQPKGVVISLGCLTDFVVWMLQEHPFAKGGETFLNQAPFSFDLSIMDLYCSLAVGGTLVSISRDDVANPAQLFRALTSSQVTAWVSTPSFAQLCTQEKTFCEAMLPRLTRFLFCGETLAPELARELLQRFPKAEVWNTYGPTEATVATTSVRIDEAMSKRYPQLPVGFSKPRSKVLTLDEQRKPVAAGERGEIVIVGPNVAWGYLNRPELTQAVFFEFEGERAYATGDWGYYRDDLLFCEGRRDSQIKLHGYRIELGDIEHNLRALSEVKDVVVVPKMKDGKAEYLAAFIVKSDAVSPSETGNPAAEVRALKKKLAEAVPQYMVPQKMFFVPSFPMTNNGKADRKKLSEGLE